MGQVGQRGDSVVTGWDKMKGGTKTSSVVTGLDRVMGWDIYLQSGDWVGHSDGLVQIPPVC